MSKKKLSATDSKELLKILKARFEKNLSRHNELKWEKVEEKLTANPDKLWSINEMESSGGEPDVVGKENEKGEIHYYDCAAESPKGRRSICYDREGLESRKEAQPSNTAVDMANEMGIEILNEEQYRELQKFGKFDTKTSSWLKTPDAIRKLGGAIFGDYRYGQVFIYHNGAQSYYSGRGFRGIVRI
ncbi:MAG: DUF4256 domain-containing protein [Flavitalea sp.]